MKRIRLEDGQVVQFGMPDNPMEEREMFELRYKVYVTEKKYIPSAPEGIEMDEHDKNHSCRYFIAMMNGAVVGTARAILEDVLPSEKDYFSFKTPSAIGCLERRQRVEIGRIISRPHETVGMRVPRHIIIIGIFSSLVDYGLENDLLGGYGAIKKSAFEKLKKIGFPLHEIKKKQLIYNSQDSHDPLKNFFSADDPVVLLYFLTSEVQNYLNLLLERSSMFNSLGNGEYRYLGNSMSFFAKLLLKIRVLILKYAH